MKEITIKIKERTDENGINDAHYSDAVLNDNANDIIFIAQNLAAGDIDAAYANFDRIRCRIHSIVLKEQAQQEDE